MASNVTTAHRERGRCAAFFVSVAQERDGSFTADRTGCFHERLQPQLDQTSKRGRPPASRQKTADRSPRPRNASVPPAGQSNCVGGVYALVGEARQSLAAVRPQAEPGSEGKWRRPGRGCRRPESWRADQRSSRIGARGCRNASWSPWSGRGPEPASWLAGRLLRPS
jgi:hypothetical protein